MYEVKTVTSIIWMKKHSKKQHFGWFLKNLLFPLYCMFEDVVFGAFIFTWTFQS